MTPTEIKAAYKSNPKFVVDLLHMHYFKTLTYFEERIEDDLNLRISKNLYLLFKSLQHPLSFAENSGEYSFTYKTNFMGMASYVPFPLLYNSLVKCSTSENIPEMLNKMYNSNDPILVQIAEDLKRERIELSSSLFDFLKQKECQMADGNLETILNRNCNLKLLALNNYFYMSSVDESTLEQIFGKEKVEFDKIEEGKLFEEEFFDYLKNVDQLIHLKLHQ